MVHHVEEFGWEAVIFLTLCKAKAAPHCPWAVMHETPRLADILLSSRSSIVENFIFSSAQNCSDSLSLLV